MSALRLLADRAAQQQRMALCRACEFKAGPFCGKCGCPLAGKTRLAGAQCPVGKWSPSTGAKQ